MNIGMDIGYSAVKAIHCGDPSKWVSFPSVTGTPQDLEFSADGQPVNGILLASPQRVLVGWEAVIQSDYLDRREDRHWIQGDEWYNLFLAALTELTTATRAELRIVTGLPVAFLGDKDLVRDRLLGEHRPERERRSTQSLQVTAAKVIPQPFGALLSCALDDRGHEADSSFFTGTAGVVDVGGKTTNLLSAQGLRMIGRETASVSKGAWDAVRSLRKWLTDHCPDLELRDHQVIEAIIARKVKYYGETVDLSQPVDAILEPFAHDVLAAASQLWNGAAGLDVILVSGGGALLLGPYIKARFRHARTVSNPVFANALGFWRYAQYLAGQGK